MRLASGTTTVYEGTTQVVTVTVVLPDGAAYSQWVDVRMQYLGLDRDDLSFSYHPPGGFSLSEGGKLRVVSWIMPEGAITGRFQVRVLPLDDGISETGEQLEIRAFTGARLEVIDTPSREVFLNVEDNEPPDFGQDSTTRQLDENTPRLQDFDSPVSATDPNSHDLVYTLSGTDAAFLGIRPNRAIIPPSRVRLREQIFL